MPVFKLERGIKARADLVWQVISDVAGLAQVAPHISRVEILDGEGVGLRRRLYDLGGKPWEEECIAWDPPTSYTMRVDTSQYPFAFSKMEYTWSVVQRPKSVRIKMRYEFTPRLWIIGRLLMRLRFHKKFEETCADVMDNWVRRIHAREWAHRVTVATILKDKGNDIISVTPETRVLEAARILKKNRIGSVLALGSRREIAGVVSERDIVRGLAVHGPDVLERPVSTIMTAKVVVCHPEDNMIQVMKCMTDRRVRHLPVLEGDELIGIISIGDVVKTRIAELETESDAMRNYISGRQWRELSMRLGPATLQSELERL